MSDSTTTPEPATTPESATTPDPATTPTGPTVEQLASELRAVLDQLGPLVTASGAVSGGTATPCTDYDVNELRDHVVRWLTTFADGYADSEGKAPDPASVDLGPDLGATVGESGRRLLESVSGGAAERPLDLGGQAMPGDMALSMILWEYQVHGWDLARATGGDWSPADSGLDLSLAFAPMMLTPDFQGEGKAFAPRVEVADDASALDRLVALSGRDPGWAG